MQQAISELFNLDGRVAVVTGASGALCSTMARGLAEAGARVAVMARSVDKLEALAQTIRFEGGEAIATPADVLDIEQLEAARHRILEKWGAIDILVNGAGGNVAEATLVPGGNVFELPMEAFRRVMDLNLTGSLLPTQVFGREMAKAKRGVIINISSMAADRAITRVVGYSAAKAALENYTKWMAMELARSFGEGMRVNAIAPGFFIGEQNRRLLLNEDGSLTDRGNTIISNTPMGRFGEAEELVGTLVWLCSPASRFVTGVVVPVDGGFSVFSGV